MSSLNKHRKNDISYKYMHEVLGPWIPCPKSRCTGTMKPIKVRYFKRGPIHNEMICTTCEKTTRDPRHKALIQQGKDARNKKNWRQKGKQRYTERYNHDEDRRQLYNQKQEQQGGQHVHHNRQPSGKQNAGVPQQ